MSERSRKGVGNEAAIVLDIIRSNPKYTAKQIANLADKSQRKIEKHIAKLKEAGILVRKGGTYGGYWEINTEADFQ